jgi:Ras-related protein Rab-5C
MSRSDAVEFKVVFIGATSVGKSCIVKRSTAGTFKSCVPTLGASYASKSVDASGTQVRLLLWETAGQKRYRPITPMYYRGATAAVLVYSVADRESFAQIDVWLISLHKNLNTKVLMFLVGNKCDLEDIRDVGTAEGQEKANAMEAKFAEVSAKTGAGIDELFECIAQTCLEEGGTTIIQEPRVPVQKDGADGNSGENLCCSSSKQA